MEHPPKRQRISRTASRWRHQQGDVGRTSADKPQFVHQASDVAPATYEASCDQCPEAVGNPSYQGHTRKLSEGKGTIFHRRQASNESNISLGLTVTVQASINPAGSTSVLTTLPTVPTVVPYPSDLTVPAVPTASLTVPTVPSYPFTTTTSQVITSIIPTESEPAVSAAAAGTSSNGSSSSSQTTPSEGMIGLTPSANGGSTQVVLTPPPTPFPSTPSASVFPSGSNSTSSASSTFPPNENVTTSAFTTYPDGAIGYTTIDLGPMSTTESSSMTSITGALSPSALSSQISAASVSASEASTATSITPSSTSSSISSTNAQSTSSIASSPSSQPSSTGGAGGTGGGNGSTGNPGGGSGGTSSAAPSNGTNTTPTPVVVGGVVGGVAGVAVLLLVALLFLRWYKRRGQARQPLDGDDTEVAGAAGPMTQISNRFPPVAAAAGFLNRFSAPRTPPEPPERGFQRVSGRKIPSMFSGARPDSDPINPFADPMPSSVPTSYYRDSEGSFGMGGDAPGAGPAAVAGAAGVAGAGPSGAHDLPSDESVAPEAAATDAAEQEKFMPGPARVPVIHPGGPYSPAATSAAAPGLDGVDASERLLTPASATVGPGTLGRSHPSMDGSRGSRFTENVE
ncbi:MAG: hypothetical protein Q9157_003584 [Trypethelium eluteriae]